MPLSSSAGISWRKWVSALLSETVTRDPRACKKCAAATPDFPSPTTSTRLPLSSMGSLDFVLCHERCWRKQAKVEATHKSSQFTVPVQGKVKSKGVVPRLAAAPLARDDNLFFISLGDTDGLRI